MAEIKCPKCGEVIKLDKSAYDALLNEVEKEEINLRVNEQIKLVEAKYKADLAAAKTKAESEQTNKLNELNSRYLVLEQKLKASETEKALAVEKATLEASKAIAYKDQEIANLKGDIKNIKQAKITSEQQLKDNFNFIIKEKDEEIERYRSFRLGDSTKDLGESLETYCEDTFNEIRAVAYPRAYFEKDNTVVDNSKGDYVFRDFDLDGTEIVSIMFEMKNQKDNTEHKHKNEEFFKKLNDDRNKKKCEYAVLVSTLEEDSKLYNSGIVDVSHKYPKMFVIRPQQFLAIIGLIRNMSLNSLAYKKEVIEYKRQNVDITNFEASVKVIADKIKNDYKQAANNYDKVEGIIDSAIKDLQKIKDAYRLTRDWIGKAENQIPNLELRKLAKNNPTIQEKMDQLQK